MKEKPRFSSTTEHVEEKLPNIVYGWHFGGDQVKMFGWKEKPSPRIGSSSSSSLPVEKVNPRIDHGPRRWLPTVERERCSEHKIVKIKSGREDAARLGRIIITLNNSYRPGDRERLRALRALLKWKLPHQAPSVRKGSLKFNFAFRFCLTQGCRHRVEARVLF